MPTVQVVSEANIDLHTVLDGVARLDLPELERFASNVNSLVVRRKAPYLPQREAALLRKINRGVAPAVRQRYMELHNRASGVRSMSRPYVSVHDRQLVIERAHDRCEACSGCNSHKFKRITALDPIDGVDTPLFHPRQQRWQDHFVWSEDFSEVIGITSTGRATVVALHLNRAGVVSLRRLLRQVGKHPPLPG